MSLIDFKLDIYDYLTFLLLLLIVIAFFYAMVALGGLPGKLAEKRKHPHAESVKLGGWIGLFTVFPWIHALIWAYHDSLTIDVRKLPKDMKDKLGVDESAGGTEILEAGIPAKEVEDAVVEQPQASGEAARK